MKIVLTQDEIIATASDIAAHMISGDRSAIVSKTAISILSIGNDWTYAELYGRLSQSDFRSFAIEFLVSKAETLSGKTKSFIVSAVKWGYFDTLKVCQSGVQTTGDYRKLSGDECRWAVAKQFSVNTDEREVDAMDLLPDTGSLSPEEALVEKQDSELVQEFRRHLTKRERELFDIMAEGTRPSDSDDFTPSHFSRMQAHLRALRPVLIKES